MGQSYRSIILSQCAKNGHGEERKERGRLELHDDRGPLSGANKDSTESISGEERAKNVAKHSMR